MSCKTSLKISSIFSASTLFVALTASFGAQPAAANNPALHRAHHAYASHRGHGLAYPATLPHGPEYGFLRSVPPNATRTPGYTFVPGVGILGESCDLPTSACPNEYRDIQ